VTKDPQTGPTVPQSHTDKTQIKKTLPGAFEVTQPLTIATLAQPQTIATLAQPLTIATLALSHTNKKRHTATQKVYHTSCKHTTNPLAPTRLIILQ